MQLLVSSIFVLIIVTAAVPEVVCSLLSLADRHPDIDFKEVPYKARFSQSAKLKRYLQLEILRLSCKPQATALRHYR